MSNQITVWTKQHENIAAILQAKGRYIVKKEYIKSKMEEHADIYLSVYNWYYGAAGKLLCPPEDVKYPIWVSLSKESKIETSAGTVGLELQVPEERLITVDIDKWGKIVNYMYIPANAKDQAAHEAMLARYGIDDCTAYMTSFYPSIKRKIIKSWDRLFDESVQLSKFRVGTLWELKAEWVVSIIA